MGSTLKKQREYSKRDWLNGETELRPSCPNGSVSAQAERESHNLRERKRKSMTRTSSHLSQSQKRKKRRRKRRKKRTNNNNKYLIRHQIMPLSYSENLAIPQHITVM